MAHVAVSLSTSAIKSSLNFANPSSSAVELSKQVVTIKSTVKNILNPNYLRPLYDLVDNVNTLVSPTFEFFKCIFLEELKRIIYFDPTNFVKRDFFEKVFLALVSRSTIS